MERVLVDVSGQDGLRGSKQLQRPPQSGSAGSTNSPVTAGRAAKRAAFERAPQSRLVPEARVAAAAAVRAEKNQAVKNSDSGVTPSDMQRRKEPAHVSDPMFDTSDLSVDPTVALANSTDEQIGVYDGDLQSATRRRAGRVLALASDAVVLTIAAPFFAVWFVFRTAKRLIRGN